MVRWRPQAVKGEMLDRQIVAAPRRIVAACVFMAFGSSHGTEKTNVTRLCETANVFYRTHSFPVDDEHLDAVKVAELVGAEPERVFKTLVCHDGSANHMVFVVPGPFELDPRKAAKVAGVKRIELIKVADLRDVTGYIRGGCSPIGMKKHYPTWIDETAQLHETILVSAGIRGLQIELSPADLLAMSRAAFGDLC